MCKDIRVFLEHTWWTKNWKNRCYLEKRRKRKCGEGEAEIWKLFRVQDLFFRREERLISEILKLFSCEVQPLFSDCVRFSDFTGGEVDTETCPKVLFPDVSKIRKWPFLFSWKWANFSFFLFLRNLKLDGSWFWSKNLFIPGVNNSNWTGALAVRCCIFSVAKGQAKEETCEPQQNAPVHFSRLLFLLGRTKESQPKLAFLTSDFQLCKERGYWQMEKCQNVSACTGHNQQRETLTLWKVEKQVVEHFSGKCIPSEVMECRCSEEVQRSVLETQTQLQIPFPFLLLKTNICWALAVRCL